MRDFAKISTTIWNSRKFRSLPDDDARLVYLYLHTNPHVNSLGCYVLPFGYALSDLGWNDMDSDPIRYRKAIEALCNSGLIGFDKTESVVRIVDFLKHSPFTNEKHAKGAIKILYQIPYCPEKELLISDLRLMKHVNSSVFADPDDSLSKGSRYTETERETETKTQTQTKNKNGGGGTREAQSVRPDLGMVSKLAEALGFNDQDGRGWPTYWVSADAALIVGRWISDLGLTEPEILHVAVSNMRAHGEAAKGPKLLTKHMQAFAAEKSAPPLEPIAGRRPAPSTGHGITINPEDFQ